MNTFAERLRLARQMRQMTQAQLARACGVAQGTIANYENSWRQFPRVIFKLAAALKVSAQWLAEGIGPMEEYKTVSLATPRPGMAGTNPQLPVSSWPFKNISPAIYWSLTDTDRDLIEQAMAGLVTSLTAKNAK